MHGQRSEPGREPARRLVCHGRRLHERAVLRPIPASRYLRLRSPQALCLHVPYTHVPYTHVLCRPYMSKYARALWPQARRRRRRRPNGARCTRSAVERMSTPKGQLGALWCVKGFPSELLRCAALKLLRCAALRASLVSHCAEGMHVATHTAQLALGGLQRKRYGTARTYGSDIPTTYTGSDTAQLAVYTYITYIHT